QANAEPATRYLVASEAIAPGTLLQDEALVRDLFAAVPAELRGPVDERVVPVDEIDRLIGRPVLIPMQRGDLLQRTALGETGSAKPLQSLSFALARSDALGGEVIAGERIDVLATYAGGPEPHTAFVVRGAVLQRVTSSGS